MRKAICLVVLSVVGVVFLSGCITRQTRKAAELKPALAEDVYLANNIHAQDDGKIYTASYANWTRCNRHRIVPVNTSVDVHDWPDGLAILSKGEDKSTVFMEYSAVDMDMSKEEYVDKITTSEKVNLSELSDVDQEGIEAGKVKKGMTKKGVRIALGYPAQNETPSLEENTWTYWTNRWVTYDVIFNEDGTVEKIRR